jgi:hypothetical protein
MNYELNEMTLNCTINAEQITNNNFWRKDGAFIGNNDRHREIKNFRSNYNTLTSQLIIRNYNNDDDQGLYECTAENDLRVTKMVYSLTTQNEIEKLKQINSDHLQLIPIGYANNYRDSSNNNNNNNNQFTTPPPSSLNNFKRTRPFRKWKQQQQHQRYPFTRLTDQKRLKYHHRNKNSTSNDSPYIILIDDDIDGSSSLNSDHQHQHQFNKSKLSTSGSVSIKSIDTSQARSSEIKINHRNRNGASLNVNVVETRFLIFTFIISFYFIFLNY